MGGTILEHESKTIYNAGKMEGKVEEKQFVVLRLFQKGIKPETIADFVDVSVDLVEEWISALGHPTGKKI